MFLFNSSIYVAHNDYRSSNPANIIQDLCEGVRENWSGNDDTNIEFNHSFPLEHM